MLRSCFSRVDTHTKPFALLGARKCRFGRGHRSPNLQPGDALVSVVTWNNVTNRTIGFGLLSSDEMNIIFGYAY